MSFTNPINILSLLGPFICYSFLCLANRSVRHRDLEFRIILNSSTKCNIWLGLVWIKMVYFALLFNIIFEVNPQK